MSRSSFPSRLAATFSTDAVSHRRSRARPENGEAFARARDETLDEALEAPRTLGAAASAATREGDPDPSLGRSEVFRKGSPLPSPTSLRTESERAASERASSSHTTDEVRRSRDERADAPEAAEATGTMRDDVTP